MKRRLLVLSLAAWLPFTALAQSSDNYRCTNSGLVRRVEIVYETGVAVPCEVHYYKDTEAPGERQVLWQAFNESGYCESQTRDFVARLEGWGWQCAMDEARAAAGEEEGDASADDTDVLDAPEPQ